MTSIDLKQAAFTTKQACQLTGITKRKLDHWTGKGLIVPSVSSADGRGSRRQYSYRDLIAIAAIRGFRAEGVSLQKVGKCVAFLRKNLPDVSQPLTYCRLVSSGDTIILIRNEQELIDTVKNPGQMLLLNMDITAIERELRDRVLRLPIKRVMDVNVGDFAYQVQIEPDTDQGGFTATVPSLPGCVTEGETIEQVAEMAKDAIQCWLEAQEALKEIGAVVPVANKKRRRKRA